MHGLSLLVGLFTVSSPLHSGFHFLASSPPNYKFTNTSYLSFSLCGYEGLFSDTWQPSCSHFNPQDCPPSSVKPHSRNRIISLLPESRHSPFQVSAVDHTGRTEAEQRACGKEGPGKTDRELVTVCRLQH